MYRCHAAVEIRETFKVQWRTIKKTLGQKPFLLKQLTSVQCVLVSPVLKTEYMSLEKDKLISRCEFPLFELTHNK